MKRRVERRHIDEWIHRNNPNGKAKLALKGGVSDGTIDNARQGIAPAKPDTRLKICKAIGVKEDDLFPVVPDGEGQAS